MTGKRGGAVVEVDAQGLADNCCVRDTKQVSWSERRGGLFTLCPLSRKPPELLSFSPMLDQTAWPACAKAGPLFGLLTSKEDTRNA